MISPLLSAAMIAAFAVDARGISEEARQTAARVRASILTRDWSWVLGDSIPPIFVPNDDTERWWHVGIGLSRWVAIAPDFDSLVVRLQVFGEMAKLPGELYRGWTAFILPSQVRKPEAVCRLKGKYVNAQYYSLPEYQGEATKVPLPSWGRRPKGTSPIIHGMGTLYWKLPNQLMAWDTKSSPHRALILMKPSSSEFFKVVEGLFDLGQNYQRKSK
jgi:hypothetical protein